MQNAMRQKAAQHANLALSSPPACHPERSGPAPRGCTVEGSLFNPRLAGLRALPAIQSGSGQGATFYPDAGRASRAGTASQLNLRRLQPLRWKRGASAPRKGAQQKWALALGCAATAVRACHPERSGPAPRGRAVEGSLFDSAPAESGTPATGLNP
jgi:hypothetical protein